MQPIWNSPFELMVNLEINAPEGGRYRRPYVAVWVEDAEGYPVRTLALWVQAKQPGPRWVPDLRRWFRSDRLRQMNDRTDFVSTRSSPTRQPGKYNVVWDLTDDDKAPVKPGRYTLYVEAAREHGTYQILKTAINVGDKTFRENMGSNPEIKSATLDYRKRQGR